MVKVPGVQESECRCWNQSSTIWSLSLCLATLSILATCHSDQHLHPCISSFKQDAYNFANDPQHARAALALATLALALSTLRAVSGLVTDRFLKKRWVCHVQNKNGWWSFSHENCNFESHHSVYFHPVQYPRPVQSGLLHNWSTQWACPERKWQGFACIATPVKPFET